MCPGHRCPCRPPCAALAPKLLRRAPRQRHGRPRSAGRSAPRWGPRGLPLALSPRYVPRCGRASPLLSRIEPPRPPAHVRADNMDAPPPQGSSTGVLHPAEHLPGARQVASASHGLLQASAVAFKPKGVFPRLRRACTAARRLNALPLPCQCCMAVALCCIEQNSPSPEDLPAKSAPPGKRLPQGKGPRSLSEPLARARSPGCACGHAPSLERRGAEPPESGQQVGPSRAALAIGSGVKGQGCSSPHPSTQ